MTDWQSSDDPEQAMRALFDDVLDTAWPGDWAERGSRPGPVGDDGPPRPPVIRLTPERHASIDQRPDITIIPTVPAALREVVEPSRWSRHRSTVARVAAAVVILAGIGWTGRLVAGRLDGDAIDASADLVEARATTTTARSDTRGSTTATTSGPTSVPRSSAATAPAVTTTDAPPTTIASTTATPAPTAAPTTARPTTAPTTTPTTAPTTTTDPTTTSTTEPTTTTTEATTTTETTTAPGPSDVRIRNLAVSNITATSAVVTFSTADCAGVAYDVTRNGGQGARGLPRSDECWTQHSVAIGSERPLRPDSGYRVTVATVGRDGSSDKATIRFRTAED